MFTGLIEGIGKIRGISRLGDDMRLIIEVPDALTEYRVGDSVSVDGVCLTVTQLLDSGFGADVSGETLLRSTLKSKREGDAVNLEMALRLSDRLGGHLVSGHVDGVGRILKKEKHQRSWRIRIEIDEALSRYIIQKGSVAVDGISLTVNRRERHFFEVNIIPQTGEETTILEKKTGDWVNIETDIIGKYVEQFILKDRSAKSKNTDSGIGLELLKKQGYI